MIFRTNTNRIIFFLLILLLFLHIVLLANTKFTLWPEMIVYPYLFNNGFLLYKDIINPYPPALTLFLSKFSTFFGYSPQSFQILTWAIIILIDVLIFTVAAKLTKKLFFGLLSALFFIFLSIPFGINGLWFDLIQTPFILLASYFFYQFLQNKNLRNLYIAFLLTTFAIFIKQQAVWLMVLFLLIITFNKKINFSKDQPKIFLIFIPLIFLSTVHLLVFSNLGILKDFLFWNINLPLFKTSLAPGYILLPTARQMVVMITLFLIFLPIFFSKKSDYKFFVLTSLFLIIFSYPRFDYFHLIPSLATLSLLFGPLAEKTFKSNINSKPIVVGASILLLSFSIRFFINDWGSPIRFFEPEIFKAANFISKKTNRKDTLYIQNGPDQLLPLSNRLPIKPWADEFSWYLELEGIQEQIISSLINQNPKFIIYKPYDKGEKYDLGVYEPRYIAGYLDENYENLIKINGTLWLKIRK